MMLFYAHSGIRYLALLMGLVVIGYALFGMATGRKHDTTMRALGASFAGTLDLNILLGVGLLFSGRFYPAVGMHLGVMLVAAVVAHIVPAVMKRRPQESRSFMPYIVGAAVALALVATGITMLGRPIVGSGG